MKKIQAKPVDYGIPVISVGNLIVGGSGKTPLVIHLAKKRQNVAVVLRGYGRESKGLYVISKNGKLLEDVSISGDEAMLLSKSLPNATVIVSENRVDGIKKAKELNCKVVFLDDGFSKYNIHKFNILLRPFKEPTNLLCLPSGGYREPKMMYTMADLVLKEEVDFKRVVTFKQNGNIITKLPSKLILLTAISKANRLLEYLPKDTKSVIFEDHHNFTKEEVEQVIQKYSDYSIVTTAKDLVKLDKFAIKNLYLMDLELEIDDNVDFSTLENYLLHYQQ